MPQSVLTILNRPGIGGDSRPWRRMEPDAGEAPIDEEVSARAQGASGADGPGNDRAGQRRAVRGGEPVGAPAGIGEESLRAWVKQAEVDVGKRPGVSSDDRRRIVELERENRELRRA